MTTGVLLSVSEVAQRFDVDGSTVRRMLYRGEFPGAFKMSGVWRIPEADINAYIEEQRRERQAVTSTMES